MTPKENEEKRAPRGTHADMASRRPTARSRSIAGQAACRRSDTATAATHYGEGSFRSSRAWRRSESAPACTSATPPMAPAYHLVFEVVDNSIDEASPVSATTSSSPSTPTTPFSLSTTGRGIPPGVKMD